MMTKGHWVQLGPEAQPDSAARAEERAETPKRLQRDLQAYMEAVCWISVITSKLVTCCDR